MLIPYQAKVYSHDLTAKKTGSERLSASLMEAEIDLNPHQIGAALFVLRSPLSKGVILADEVGLGKTIEAGLVLCQYWTESKRHLLVICPASLRQQWALEMKDKFHLPSTIIEEKTSIPKEGVSIMSYHFAANHKTYLKAFSWDICVLDEAHKVRKSAVPLVSEKRPRS